jgi:hypothetical protein
MSVCVGLWVCMYVVVGLCVCGSVGGWGSLSLSVYVSVLCYRIEKET